MLATLYGRALDSRLPASILHDDEAARAVKRIDYDFRKTGIKRTSAVGVAVRAKTLDDWAAAFLARNQEATVLHLACGLDTRAQRLSPPASVAGVDVDFPEVIELRERLLPSPAGDYRMVRSSVTSDEWLQEIPADRPTVAVFEGLSMYLTKDDGKRLIQRITPSAFAVANCSSTATGLWAYDCRNGCRQSGGPARHCIGESTTRPSWKLGMTGLNAENPGTAWNWGWTRCPHSAG
nr:class I SAM-dependent methyltransferase [Fodinicola feengrottensis]